MSMKNFVKFGVFSGAMCRRQAGVDSTTNVVEVGGKEKDMQADLSKNCHERRI